MNTSKKTYQAAAANNVVIAGGKCVLHRILVGADVGSAVIEVSDHATDGDGNVKIYFAGSTIMTSVGGVIEVEALFNNGITADITLQSHLTFIWDEVA